MLDQNVATIITTAITATSTLLAGFLGVYLTNRHTEKLEKMKTEKEEEERAKIMVEEIYRTLLHIDSLFNAVIYDMTVNRPLSDVEMKMKEIRNALDNLTLSTNLYAPVLKEHREKHQIGIQSYIDVVKETFYFEGQSQQEKEEMINKHIKVGNEYKITLEAFKRKLEEMVKGKKLLVKTA